ncbi:hypothetical protein PACTADRAFT_85748 [Pachysolen tannophilus NRRL Y-2460]|uniref:Uncharacterized protein n=1 Tax=Pachysolen tannophilus NRRL Y-2460 TaxID=669874 RepID=A0A1E4TVL4_PACTA|nr:hypothetical protein PACTADRAFT_85748 [Pachysolen tannophilus NRRL Y-2460]
MSTHLYEENISDLSVLTPIKRKFNTSPPLLDKIINNDQVQDLKFDLNVLKSEYADLMVKNSHFLKEQQILENDLLLKEKELLNRSKKINELISENKNLEKKLKDEIEAGEKEYANWNSMRSYYEQKINNLNRMLKEQDISRKEFEINNNIAGNSSFNIKNGNDTSGPEETIKTLTKKLKILERDHELEKTSKMLIIDEFELLKQKFLELEMKCQLLESNRDRLMLTDMDLNQDPNDSIGSVSSYGSNEVEKFILDNDDDNDDNSNSDNNSDNDNCKGQIIQTNNILDSFNDADHITLNSPITLADELSATVGASAKTELYASNNLQPQELIKLEFQIRSLQLQNEKLHSYIGFLLQQNSINSLSTNDQALTKADNIEYSDEKLISSAKRNLSSKRILRSVSAMPINLEISSSRHSKQQKNSLEYPYATPSPNEWHFNYFNSSTNCGNERLFSSSSTSSSASSSSTSTTVSDHATDEEMSMFLGADYCRNDQQQWPPRLHNICSTANLKKLHYAKSRSSLNSKKKEKSDGDIFLNDDKDTVDQASEKTNNITKERLSQKKLSTITEEIKSLSKKKSELLMCSVSSPLSSSRSKRTTFELIRTDNMIMQKERIILNLIDDLNSCRMCRNHLFFSCHCSLMHKAELFAHSVLFPNGFLDEVEDVNEEVNLDIE